MRRREFLATGMAAAAAPDRIRIGFLGSSHPHAAEKIRLVRASPRLELAGISEDAGPTRDALLGDASIPVIAVESRVKMHAAHALLALEAGKHVHLEKPPADNMRDFRKIVALARRKNLIVQMGYMWRCHPAFNAVLEAARQGWLGEIYLVRGTINTFTPPEGRAGAAPETPGGHMFELGCHLVDPLVRLLGAPARVTPSLHSHGGFPDRFASNTAAVFEYPRAIGIVTASMLQPNPFPYRAFEVFGSNGTAVLRPLEPGTLALDLVKAAGPYKAGRQQIQITSFQRYIGDFEELAEAVRTGKPLTITPEEDLRVHEALLRASGMWDGR